MNQLKRIREATIFSLYGAGLTFFWLLIFLIFTHISHGCSRDPETLTTEAKSKYYQLVENSNVDFILICAERLQEEQDNLYAQGRTAPGKIVTWVKESKHTQGKAFDVAIIKNGQITWEPKEYEILGLHAKRIGLIWGGDWKVRDYGHFEVK